ncbi:predicted protein [Naegleria gruberi]|uniref:Predicted protein n=1 Tax=Naegleria gruberi TaxID=5762 RepID=D2VL50_NAEGR|nr:uncharacterized protein NAEGRDRAFT_69662 [Naegleria gruberi]EFC42557.1 predicted protein [Naegleria gruberi]|eukprot:XP_002675301.1 predicted protein [Naegleria gruberi strain NEG-M]
MIRGILGLKKKSKKNKDIPNEGNNNNNNNSVRFEERQSLDVPSAHDTIEPTRKSLDSTSTVEKKKRRSFLSFRRKKKGTEEIIEPPKDTESDEDEEELNNIIDSQLLPQNQKTPRYYSSYIADSHESQHTSTKPIKPFKYISVGDLKLLNIKEEAQTASPSSELYIIAQLNQGDEFSNFCYKLPLLTKNEFLEWKDCDVEFVYDKVTSKKLMRSSVSISDLLEMEEASSADEHFTNLIIPSKSMISDLTKDYVSIRVFEKTKDKKEDELLGYCNIDLFTIALHPLIDLVGVSLTKDEKTLSLSEYIVSFSITTSLAPPTKHTNGYLFSTEDSLIIQGQFISPFSGQNI